MPTECPYRPPDGNQTSELATTTRLHRTSSELASRRHFSQPGTAAAKPTSAPDWRRRHRVRSHGTLARTSDAAAIRQAGHLLSFIIYGWMTTSKQVTIQEPGKRERIRLGEAMITITVSSDQTAGEFAVVEYDVPAGFPAPPLHVHPSFDEFFLRACWRAAVSGSAIDPCPEVRARHCTCPTAASACISDVHLLPSGRPAARIPRGSRRGPAPPARRQKSGLARPHGGG